MTYRDVLARLYATRRFGVRFELERVRRLLDRLDRPDRAVGRIARIGGTNGKGSTVAFVEALARRGSAGARARTGAFTSPHLSRLAERFRVDGAAVSDDDVARAATAVFAAVDASDEPITFFEQVAAMALVVFARAGVDVAILEVGMGGRLDATNAVSADVSCVTGVALDHQQFLGDTIEAIAFEKAGIFEAGKVAVVGSGGEPAGEAALIEGARAAGATVVRPSPVPAQWSLGLRGAFQRANAACAVAVAEHLVALDPAAVREALAATRCPGRFDRVAEEPVTIVDGAHNPHAAAAIAAEVRPDVCVIAVGGGKDIDGVIGPLIRGARLVFATAAPPADRMLPAGDVGAACRRLRPDLEVVVEADPGRAIDGARAAAGDGVVLVAGSLFLAGAARRHLCGDAADPVFLADPGNLPPL